MQSSSRSICTHRRMVALLSLLHFATAMPAIGFYTGPGTSSNLDPFYSTLSSAAHSALGEYTISNLSTAEHVIAFAGNSRSSLMVFPGGSGNGQAQAIGAKGMSAIRSFVAGGGGYLGTCGGAFLGLSHLKFFGDPSPPTQEPYDRGHGDIQLRFSQDGLNELGLDRGRFSGNVTIMYWQGPIVSNKDLPANVTRVASFLTEIHSRHTNQTTGEMAGTAAITSIEFGRGRVVLNSPHPELTPNLPEIYAGELSWLSSKA